MSPVPREYNANFWTFDPAEFVELTCLMPNGIVILLKVPYNATLAEVKEELWDEAAKYPLYGKLHDMSVYIFTCINSMAEREVLHDEYRRLPDIRPTCAVLKVEPLSNKADNQINVQIGHLIGKRLQEFDSLNSPEVNDFRFKMRKLGDEIAQNRTKYNWEDKLYYQFPPRLTSHSTVFHDFMTRNKNIKIAAKSENNESSFTFNVPASLVPKKLLELILTKKANFLNIRSRRLNDYVLKVCGRDEYLIGSHPLIEFQFVQDSVSRDIIPVVVLTSVDRVPNHDYETLDNFDKKPRQSHSTLTLRKKSKQKSAWNVPDLFTVTINMVTGLNCDTKRYSEIGIQAGLFHGGKSLCQPQKTLIQPVEENSEIAFNEALMFDMQVCNIPRNAKLCIFIYEVAKTRTTRTRKYKDFENKELFCNPISWANTSVYDFKGRLKSGAMTLYMWTFAEEMITDDLFHPLGTVVSNPNTKIATALTLDFNRYSDELMILYPSVDMMVTYATDKMNRVDCNNYDMDQCFKLLQQDNLYEVHEQDRKNLWLLKDYWRKEAPGVLPRLLSAIDWDNKAVISEVSVVLQKWPKLPPEKALELLDYAYADQGVRRFAVQCISNVGDDDLLLYLLQLVQAIKHEMYLDCDLVKFLLKRSLNNQKIGHYLFWHLRSEMQVPSVSVRFGLILEAYCRGSQEHMLVLSKQLDCLEKLKKCSALVKNKNKEKAKTILKDFLSEQHTMETMRHIRNPLDPSMRCTNVILEKCRVMDSKMRPLWIVLANSDLYGNDVYIIFKNGDDLRQDMLTLQMLRIMDRLWKREGLDLRMNAYNCISLEHRLGMIEVVSNAETIANIQNEKGTFTATSAFRKGSILAWLRDYNTTEVALNKAIKEFTLSCAGYCVATYVLGIADRHSDNIMVKKTGQLFHIDFGHILGHFKEKFGIKRERVPFVLTHDFVYVINNGQKTSLQFTLFQEYCEKAFMILRKHGNLILSLCAMMISTGLPELTSEKDLHYLKETLVLSKSDEDAIHHFRCKFDEALSNSWKTCLNWASHNLTKNNKA